jgi:hypothetical protein
MNKTGHGFMLVGGIIVALLSGVFVAAGSSTPSSPGMDFYYDLIKYAGILGVLVGIGMFFFGAKGFAAAK